MARYDYDMGVIGGGAAGLTVAAGCAQLGLKTLLIEKEPVLGGDCLHFGCVPSKTLIRTAQVYHQTKRLAAYGLPSVEPPPVDYGAVADRIRRVIAKIQTQDSEERFCGLGAQVEHGRPRFIDDHRVDLDGRSVSARYWAICTGSSPAAPAIPGMNEAGYLTNKDIFSLDRLPASLISIGGGPIGMEMSQAFARLGTRVTVLQRGDQILDKEDKDMADLVLDRLIEEGLDVRLGVRVDRVEDRGSHKAVFYTDAEGTEASVQAENILAAVGRSPNVDDLDLERAGVTHDRRGIQVDQRCRTDRKHIFAAGDASGGYLFTHAAGYEGGIIVANTAFHLPRETDYTFLPWCTYVQPELASIGMNEKRAAQAGIKPDVWTESFEDNDRAQAEGEGFGRLKMVMDEKENPVGVQIVGPQAGELLNEWVAVFAGKVKLTGLAGAVHPYPTLSEINKRVAGDFVASKLYSDKVKKALKFFFNFKGRACESNQTQ